MHSMNPPQCPQQGFNDDSTPSWTYTLLAVILLFAFFNAKSLPGAWHVRTIRQTDTEQNLTPSQAQLFAKLARHIFAKQFRLIIRLFNRLVLRRKRETSQAQDARRHGLFESIVTNSYCSLLEVDYNIHKSNSTFFSDLDLNRTELILTLFKDALSPPKPKPWDTNTPRIAKKSIALGAVSCSFKRQIRPLERYQICSRVLCWDEKWIYVVSQFVSCPSINGKERSVFASSMARYVFKEGRRTVSPDIVLAELGLTRKEHPDMAGPVWSEPKARASKGAIDWEIAQQKRLEGLSLASSFSALDQMHQL